MDVNKSRQIAAEATNNKPPAPAPLSRTTAGQNK